MSGTETIREIDEETVVVSDIINSKRFSVNLRVERSNQAILPFSVYFKHNIDTDWSVGHRYRIENVKLRSTGRNQYLVSTVETTVQDITKSSNTIDLILVGDTHIGYHHKSSPDTRYNQGDEFRTLKSIVDNAIELEIDAVVHTGDLFDHRATLEDYRHAKKEIYRLYENGIALSFVKGNHDEKVSKFTSDICSLPSVDCLGESGNWKSFSGFTIIGYNYDGFQGVNGLKWGSIEEDFSEPIIFIGHPTSIDQKEELITNLVKSLESQWMFFFGHKHREKVYEIGSSSVVFTGFPIGLQGVAPIWRLRGGNGYCSISMCDLSSESRYFSEI